MYELPSRDDIAKVVIDEKVVLEKVNPTLVPRSARKQAASENRPRRAAS
jgi:ATP-dependent Clp protease ATP-binding subunit ClpX